MGSTKALKAGYGFDAQAPGTRKDPASHKPTASTAVANKATEASRRDSGIHLLCQVTDEYDEPQ
jgi:hypothetical protein